MTMNEPGGIDWGAYEIYDPGVDGPLQLLTRPEAQFAFKKLMAERRHRVDLLMELASQNGCTLNVEGDGLDEFCAWFSESMEEDPQKPGRLRGRWYSVINDIALFLGDLAIERSGGQLRWELCIGGKKNVAYQRHVLMGFGRPNPKINRDLDRMVANYAYGLLQGEPADPGRFSFLLRVTLEQVQPEETVPEP